MTIDRDPTERDAAEARFRQSPRPLDFVRVRYYRGGMAEYVRELFTDEVEALFDDLAKLRGKGAHEDDPELVENVQRIRWLNNALRDLSNGLIELVGEDGI